MCFKGLIFTQNLGFWHVKGSFGKHFWKSLMFWMLYTASLVMLILDKIDYYHELAKNDGIPTRNTLDIYPFFTLVVFIIVNTLIICIRHATTPSHVYSSWFGSYPVLAVGEETFITETWIEISPKFLMQELNYCMIDEGADPGTFTFKVLSPLFPFIEKKITLEGSDFTTQSWDFAKDIKDRKQRL